MLLEVKSFTNNRLPDICLILILLPINRGFTKDARNDKNSLQVESQEYFDAREMFEDGSYEIGKISESEYWKQEVVSIENALPESMERVGSLDDFDFDHILYLIYNRKNKGRGQLLSSHNISAVRDTTFDFTKPTIVFIHGFLEEGYTFASSTDMRKAYLSKLDINFIAVDWSFCSKKMYTRAVACIDVVGEIIAEFLQHIWSLGCQNIRLVGFSLGAHVSGRVAASVNFTIKRLTALDAAGPLMGNRPVQLRKYHSLDDAEFIESIHTDNRKFGCGEYSGHANFYANGGCAIQPGCAFKNIGCSHFRAVQLWTESIISEIGFYARKCDSWENYINGKCDANDDQLVGEYASTLVRGNYHFKTNSGSPLAMGFH